MSKIRTIFNEEKNFDDLPKDVTKVLKDIDVTDDMVIDFNQIKNGIKVKLDQLTAFGPTHLLKLGKKGNVILLTDLKGHIELLFKGSRL